MALSKPKVCSSVPCGNDLWVKVLRDFYCDGLLLHPRQGFVVHQTQQIVAWIISPLSDEIPAARLAARTLLGGLFDRFRAAIGRGGAADASTGAIHQCAGFAERTCDAAAGAARRPRYEGDASSQRLAGGSLLCHARNVVPAHLRQRRVALN